MTVTTKVIVLTFLVLHLVVIIVLRLLHVDYTIILVVIVLMAIMFLILTCLIWPPQSVDDNYWIEVLAVTIIFSVTLLGLKATHFK